MTIRRFFLIDSLLLDIAGIVALIEGATELGIALLILAAAAFVAFLALGRREASAVAG